MYASGDGSLNRSWLEMDRVDPSHATQPRNVGVATIQGGNEQ